MTSPGVHLPWPPPGLEPLRGRLLSIARRLGIANLFFLSAFAGFSLNSPSSASAGSATVCFALAMIGTALFVSSAYSIWHAVREGGASVWRGYTWLTVVEVMVDRTGDSGTLISGTGHFVALSAETRNNLRIARGLSGVARLAAGLLPLPIFFLQSAVGASGSAGMGLSLAIAALPSMVLLAFASVAGSGESVALRPHREAQRKRFDRRTDAIKIADEWYGSFETAREGQGIGRGPAGGVLRTWAVGGVMALGLAAVAVTFVPIWLVVAAGSAGAFSGMPVFANSLDRSQLYSYLRAYTPPVDTTITPERAGAAFNTLMGEKSAAAYIKPPPEKLTPFPLRGDTLFRDGERGYGGWPGPRSPHVLDFAKKGLTPAQRDYLAAVANNKVWEPFGIVARARRADIAGGRFILPLPADLSLTAITGASFAATRQLAYANTARAAYHLANGNVWEADRDIRETIGLGFRQIDDGNSSLDVLMGSVVLGIGHDALLKLYTLTNNPNLANFRAYSEGAKAGTNIYLADPSHGSNNRGTPRGIRLELMQARQMLACASIRGLLFGPSTQEQRELKSLRAQIARTPAEEALFDLSADAINRPVTASDRAGATQSAVLLAARISGALLRSPRIYNCAARSANVRTFGAR